jgi:hypothetical protein
MANLVPLTFSSVSKIAPCEQRGDFRLERVLSFLKHYNFSQRILPRQNPARMEAAP